MIHLNQEMPGHKDRVFLCRLLANEQVRSVYDEIFTDRAGDPPGR